MQINELIKLTDWFQAKVVAKGIPANFQALFNKMNANIRRNVNQPLQPFSTERDALFETIRPINFQSLSLEQINFLKELEIDELFGPIGVDRIEGILYKNNLFEISNSGYIEWIIFRCYSCRSNNVRKQTK